MSRVEKAVKNTVVSVVAYVVTYLLMFATRRVFVDSLGIEYLGYETLFANVFSLLSFADLGIQGIITFHLYREIAAGNDREICKLMTIYKWLYRIVALTVLIMGVAIAPFLPHLVKNASSDWSFIYSVYYLQLVGVLATYLLAYKRAVLTADQREYRCAEVDLAINFAIQILEIMTLIAFKSFFLYLALKIVGNVLANIIISSISRKQYPFLAQRCKVTKKDLQERSIFTDMRNFLTHKISYAVYGGTSSIVISAFCGVTQVAIYGNYLLLQRGILNICFYKMLNPIQASIGNMVYDNVPMDAKWKMFKVFDMVSFFFASYIGLGFLIFFQPAIQLWMGKAYLLPFSFVVAYAATTYIGAVFEIVYKYRSAFGDFRQDRNMMVLSAILGLVLSLILVQVLGVTGVQIASLFALLPIVYGRIRFVVGGYFKKSIRNFIGRHFLLLLLVAVEGAVACVALPCLPITILGLTGRLLLWAVLPLIGVAIFWRTPEFKEMLHYIKRVLDLVVGKLKRSEQS